MVQPALVVLDDFYPKPDTIRDVALSLSFRRHAGVNYPGGEAVAALDWSSVRRRLRSFIPEDVDGECPKPTPFPQGLFRLALAADADGRPDGVHQDVQRWSAVIYLSRPEDCRGGVTFYRHRETGAFSMTPDWEQAVFGDQLGLPDDQLKPLIQAYLKDMRHWEEIQHIAMRYNRAVLLMAQCFHASAGLFGDDPETGRLTQHFEFYPTP